jgi:hypothetical protein
MQVRLRSPAEMQRRAIMFTFTYLASGSDYPEKQVSEPWINSIPPGDVVLQFESEKK